MMMTELSNLTAPMFDALRSIQGGIFTAKEIGASPAVLNCLSERGFVQVDREYSPFLYHATPMGLGAIAVLNAPVVPKDAEGPISRIQRTVAQYYGIAPIEMVSARRSRRVARPRQIAMYLARELTPFSLPEIGRRFGNRDHTTVLHAVRLIGHLDEHDAKISHDINHLLSELEDMRD